MTDNPDENDNERPLRRNLEGEARQLRLLVERQERDIAELRARIDALVAGTGAIAACVDEIDALASREHLSALLDLIAEAVECVCDGITYVEERLGATEGTER